MKTNYKGKAIAFSCISAYLLFLSVGAYGNGDLPFFVFLLIVTAILIFLAIRNIIKQKEINDAKKCIYNELEKVFMGLLLFYLVVGSISTLWMYHRNFGVPESLYLDFHSKSIDI